MAHTTASLARDIGSQVGGPVNVTSVTTCTTRLRFTVRDESTIDLAALGALPGVIQAVRAGGQVQVVIGTHVDEVRDALLATDGWGRFAAGAAAGAPQARRSVLDVTFDFLGGTFQPLLAPITGAAMVQVLALLLSQFHVLATDSPTYLVLNATGNAIFYFLPIFVAFTASRKLNVNGFVGATVAAALLHPSFVGLGAAGDVVHAFGAPLYVYSYASSMFPSLLIALGLAGLDRVLKRWLPKPLQQVFVPTFELLLLVPAAALVFGPIGSLLATGISSGTTWLSTSAPFAFYVLIPAVWIVLVSLGIHWAVIAVAISDMATTGSSTILGAGAGYQYAVMGVAIGMVVRAIRDRKDPALRGLASAAATAMVIGGISEPTLYGLILRYRRLLVIELVAAASAGVMLGIGHTAVTGFAPAPILGLPLIQPTAWAAAAMVVAIVVSIVLIQVFGYESKGAGQDGAAVPAPAAFQGSTAATLPRHAVVLSAPIAGSLHTLAETRDPVFGAGLLGKGVAIQPAAGRVVAPAVGVVVSAPASAHAVGLRTDDGLEVLIHVGIDTVKLAGKHFRLAVAQGERVVAGQLLLEFDAASIAAEGYSLISPVIVTNATSGYDIAVADGPSVVEGDRLLTVRREDAAAPVQ